VFRLLAVWFGVLLPGTEVPLAGSSISCEPRHQKLQVNLPACNPPTL
jgi:hypothetical protein